MGRRTQGLALSGMVAVLIALSPPFASADDGNSSQNLTPTKGSIDLGILFNTNDLLLGLQSYQGGVGAKIGWGSVCVRGLIDFAFNKSAQSFAIGAGTTFEYHPLSGPISPYMGASVGLGYDTQSNVASAVTFSLGALAGVEVFIFDFLSVFAEYSLAADLINTTDLQTSQSTFDSLITTRMGNNAQIGVVIYFLRSGTKAK
jgi:hypothetical protein